MSTVIDALAALGALSLACSAGLVVLVLMVPREHHAGLEADPLPRRHHVRLLPPVYDHEDDDGWPA